ncbi:MAG: ATP-binding cassette domain-containing protein [Deltaproteobacteria bacterium]|nr:ATP-binding cassette domain-containing protein [Deltaproteobacteria bacterium]MBW1873952.1 ATP-binding cassette domain-containing protein [Deltaproteobacteria bacterium]MBW2210086.1 ATP-binding cassette domain-containing protein [Deltaproteobacteria bacterium]MBW2213323.1 ATP-binding cassette domain-containing protein [Deltaproteobacteria bacterium]MBW2378198.1 ATP-binding cassette domain-containing protein [Deltaproteobacteria bacterium]
MGILAYRGVSKRFGQHTALEGVSLEVVPGEVFGLLGPNGAGKTTLIRIGLDILRADEGEVSLFGASPNSKALDRTAYLPEERGVYRRARVRELLGYLGRLKGLKRADARNAADHWLERVGLSRVADQRVESLSKGMTQKVQIAACLMTNPELCVLDEPFSGLDPVNVALVTDLIEERRASGRTTVLSTHMMHQVEALCDRVALIHRGNLVMYGELDEIRRRYSPHEVIVWTGTDLVALGVRATQHEAGAWRVALPPSATPAGYLQELVQSGVLVDRYEPLVARMDDIFVDLVGGGR